jgi:hypothetical protein
MKAEKTVVDELYKKLKADFPKEAMQVDSSRGFDLTSIKAQYIIERMNDVFGIDGWRFTGTYQSTEKGVIYLGKLIYRVGTEDCIREGVGYSDNKKNMGDTYKGATTDFVSKVCSHLGVGNEVFKGNVDVRSIKENSEDKPRSNFTSSSGGFKAANKPTTKGFGE